MTMMRMLIIKTIVWETCNITRRIYSIRIPEIALVTAIRGEWRAGDTPYTACIIQIVNAKIRIKTNSEYETNT